MERIAQLILMARLLSDTRTYSSRVVPHGFAHGEICMIQKVNVLVFAFFIARIQLQISTFAQLPQIFARYHTVAKM